MSHHEQLLRFFKLGKPYNRFNLFGDVLKAIVENAQEYLPERMGVDLTDPSERSRQRFYGDCYFEVLHAIGGQLDPRNPSFKSAFSNFSSLIKAAFDKSGSSCMEITVSEQWHERAISVTLEKARVDEFVTMLKTCATETREARIQEKEKEEGLFIEEYRRANHFKRAKMDFDSSFAYHACDNAVGELVIAWRAGKDDATKESCIALAQNFAEKVKEELRERPFPVEFYKKIITPLLAVKKEDAFYPAAREMALILLIEACKMRRFFNDYGFEDVRSHFVSFIENGSIFSDFNFGEIVRLLSEVEHPHFPLKRSNLSLSDDQASFAFNGYRRTLSYADPSSVIDELFKKDSVKTVNWLAKKIESYLEQENRSMEVLEKFMVILAQKLSQLPPAVRSGSGVVAPGVDEEIKSEDADSDETGVSCAVDIPKKVAENPLFQVACHFPGISQLPDPGEDHEHPHSRLSCCGL